jgi:hypothetical protein
MKFGTAMADVDCGVEEVDGDGRGIRGICPAYLSSKMWMERKEKKERK